MAKHYLSSDCCLDKAFSVLDSAAARASSQEVSETSLHKSFVTHSHLTQVIANWTGIPFSHLQNNKFQNAKFIDALRRSIMGQDAAIQAIGSLLQMSCLKLNKKPGPLCSLLLIGEHGVGKTTFAYAMKEHLFGQSNALITIDFPSSIDYNNLLTAVRQTPYCILLIENIEHLNQHTLHLVTEIVAKGHVFDAQKNKIDFSQAIVIITTTLGAKCISGIHETIPEKNKTVDLMQLVLNEQLQDPTTQAEHPLSQQQMNEEIQVELANYFPSELLNHVNVVPFIPLDYSALEKIIHAKLKTLVRRLEANFGIELNYAPEVIKFLAHEALWQKTNSKSLEKLLEQHLYSCVSHEILAHSDDKNKPKNLLLQLNECGQLLRCELANANVKYSN
jgi:ATP-dependent Clp protease ATP-binding subunit ClpA